MKALIVLLLSVAAAGSTSARSPIVSVELSARDVRIGERLAMTIAVEGVGTLSAGAPALGAAIGSFEVIDLAAIPVSHADGVWRVGWIVALTTFEHGALTVPPIPIDLTLSDGIQVRVDTPPVVVRSAEATGRRGDELRPLTSILDAPRQALEATMTIVRWMLAALSGGVGAVVFRRRAMRWQRQRAFWRGLVAEANALKHSGESTPREQYMRASQLLRRGIAPVADRRIEPLTSSELAAVVGASGRVGAEIGPALKMLLAHLDAVRFGGMRPSGETRRRAVDALVTLLHALSAIASGHRLEVR